MAVEARPGERERMVAERLRTLLARRVSGPDAQWLAVFARLLVQRDAGWIEGLADEEAAALVASAFRFYAALIARGYRGGDALVADLGAGG